MVVHSRRLRQGDCRVRPSLGNAELGRLPDSCLRVNSKGLRMWLSAEALGSVPHTEKEEMYEALGSVTHGRYSANPPSLPAFHTCFGVFRCGHWGRRGVTY